jgi:hypothetical protein
MNNGKMSLIAGRISYLFLPPIFITLIPLGLLCNVPWLGILVGAVVVPVADEMIGRRDGPVTGPTSMEVRSFLVVLLLVLGWSITRVARLESWVAVVMAGASSGYVVGAIGIAAAHELGHRRLRFDRWLSQALLACIGYGHYQVAHKRHHVRAGLHEDPATARREESLWFFFPRYFRGIWRDANEVVASSRGYRRYKPALLLAASGALFGLSGALFGPKALVFWATQAAVGLFLIGSVDYIQHWGLRRKLLENGHHERQGPSHTWESSFWLSERVTFNLTRHNFHHLAPPKEASCIERIPTAPHMPFGYGTMVIIAAIPALFRKLMEPRLSSYLANEASGGT